MANVINACRLNSVYATDLVLINAAGIFPASLISGVIESGLTASKAFKVLAYCPANS